MFRVLAQYKKVRGFPLKESDADLFAAAGEPASGQWLAGGLRSLVWKVPTFGQAVAMKDVLNRLSGVNATVREEMTIQSQVE